MDKLAALVAYIDVFRAKATQLNTRRHARLWMEMGVPAEQAADWANAGYQPDEAKPLIAQGITPELAAAGDDALVDEHGIIGAAVLKLQMEEPGATILVDPDVEEPQS